MKAGASRRRRSASCCTGTCRGSITRPTTTSSRRTGSSRRWPTATCRSSSSSTTSRRTASRAGSRSTSRRRCSRCCGARRSARSPARYLARRVDLAKAEIRRLRQRPRRAQGRAPLRRALRADGGVLRVVRRRPRRRLPPASGRGPPRDPRVRARRTRSCPLVATPEARRLQVELGVALYREVFGRPPAGFWLPECAYAPGIDHVARGRRDLVRDPRVARRPRRVAAAVVGPPPADPPARRASPRSAATRSRAGRSGPRRAATPATRRTASSTATSASTRRTTHIHPFLHDDGIRRNVGIKYHRVTGKVELHEKEPYDVPAAKARAAEHARHFVDSRASQVDGLLARRRGRARASSRRTTASSSATGGTRAPGSSRRSSARRTPARCRSGSRRRPRRSTTAAPSPRPTRRSRPGAATGSSTCGSTADTAWILRHQHELERRMVEHARKAGSAEPRALRASSTRWRASSSSRNPPTGPSSSRNKTAAHYAEMRFRGHVDRFLRLEALLEGAADDDPEFLDLVDAEDSLFPGLDHRGITRGPLIRPRKSLGTPA